MKTTILAALLLASCGATSIALAIEQAGPSTDTSPSTPAIVEAAPAEPAVATQWSAEVADVVKLVKAKVDERTIVAFVTHTDREYRLNAAEIVELKHQGVSDSILTAMLQQNQKVTQPVTPMTAAAVAPQVMSPNFGTAQMGYDPNAVAASQPVYVYPESSSYSSSYYPYYSDYYPYYYPYWGGYYGYYPFYCGYYYGGGYCYPYGHHGGYCYPYGHYGYGGYHGGSYYHGGSPYSHGGYHGSPASQGAPRSGGYQGGYARAGGYAGGAPRPSGYHGGGYIGSHGAARPGGYAGGGFSGAVRGGASFASASHGGGGGHGGGHR